MIYSRLMSKRIKRAQSFFCSVIKWTQFEWYDLPHFFLLLDKLYVFFLFLFIPLNLVLIFFTLLRFLCDEMLDMFNK